MLPRCFRTPQRRASHRSCHRKHRDLEPHHRPSELSSI